MGVFGFENNCVKAGTVIQLTHPDTQHTIAVVAGSDVANEYYSKGYNFSGDGLKTKSNQSLAESFCQTNAGNMIYERDTNTFWLYDCDTVDPKTKETIKGKGTWSPYEKHAMRKALTKMVKGLDGANKLTRGKLDDVISHCADSYAKEVDSVRDTHIAFRDVLLDTKTLMPCDKSPDHFASVYVDWDYAKLDEAKSPMFDRFMRETCVDMAGNPDRGMEMMLQEAAGYLFSGVRGAKSFMFYGRTRTGKSVFMGVLRLLVGKHRTTSATLDKLTNEPFSKASLRGKLANMVDEDQSLDDKRRNEIGTFKLLVANEPMSFRNLYEEETTARLNALLFWCGNVLMSIKGFDDAVKERIIIIRFPHFVPPEERIPDLAELIIGNGEGPAIIRWALAGLKRLKENNFVFTVTKDSRDLLDELEGASSSVLDFCRTFYEKDVGGAMSSNEIYQHYCVWCEEEGREAVSKNRFGRESKPVLGDSYQTNLLINGKLKHCLAYHCRPKTLDYMEIENQPKLPPQVSITYCEKCKHPDMTHEPSLSPGLKTCVALVNGKKCGCVQKE